MYAPKIWEITQKVSNLFYKAKKEINKEKVVSDNVMYSEEMC